MSRNLSPTGRRRTLTAAFTAAAAFSLVACTTESAEISDEVQLSGTSARWEVTCVNPTTITHQWGYGDPRTDTTSQNGSNIGFSSESLSSESSNLILEVGNQGDTVDCSVNVEDRITKGTVFAQEITKPSNFTILIRNGSAWTQKRIQAEELAQKQAERKEIPIEISYSCGPVQQDPSIDTPEKARAACGEQRVEATLSGKGRQLSPQQQEALTTAYGEDAEVEQIETLFSICAKEQIAHDNPYGLSESQAAEQKGALILCPDHPDSERVEQAAQLGAHNEELRETNRIISEGSSLAGQDFVPGVYETYNERVESCYWEISDAQGNILSNNFVSVAGRLTVDLSNAYGFTTHGCGSWKAVS